MESILENIMKEKGVLSVNILTSEGMIIKSLSHKGIDNELIAALSSKIFSEIAEKIQIKKNVTLIIKGENGYILMVAKKNFILSALTESDINIGALKIEMESGAKAIEGLF